MKKKKNKGKGKKKREKKRKAIHPLHTEVTGRIPRKKAKLPASYAIG